MSFSGSGSGTEQDPYVITNVQQLQEMNDDPSAHYVLGNDIDASATATWNNGAGFEPFDFLGSFDGNRFKITGLYVNRPVDDSIGGLFTKIDFDGVVKNLILENVYVVGNFIVGGLAGRNWGTVDRSYSTGDVKGNFIVGGLAGTNYGYVSHSYSTGDVEGESEIGGLVGTNWSTVDRSYSTSSVTAVDKYVGGLVGANYGYVSHSYSTGDVKGNFIVGGLAGRNDGSFTSCYWDTQTSGMTQGVGIGSSTGVEGKTTAEMKQKATFEGWGFDNTWGIDEGESYPYLLIFAPEEPPGEEAREPPEPKRYLAKPSIVVTRARRRGATESLKNNNARNQILHDIRKLHKRLVEQGNAIDSDFEDVISDIYNLHNKAHSLEQRIKFLLQTTV